MRIGNDKKKVGEPSLIVNKNIMKWKDSTIQIKNISSLSVAKIKPNILYLFLLFLAFLGCIYLLANKMKEATSYSSYYYYMGYGSIEDQSLIERAINNLGARGIIGMLVLLGVTIGFFVAFCLYLKHCLDCQQYRYLCIEMNSGNTILFLFKHPDFLKKVLLVLNDLIESPSVGRSIQINIKDNIIKDNVRILHNASL